jgi:bifunctional non-homologous end joining protein LigD
MSTTAVELEVAGKKLKLSNLDKMFYPKDGFTKAHVIDYYTRVAPYMLPHLHNRPLTLKRYPNGADGEFFYEKNCPVHRPKWVRTAPIWSEGNNRFMDFCMCNDLPTLIWAANLASIEMHTSLSLAKDILRPTMLAFDLDPGAPANIIDCCEVAMWLREIFDKLDLQSFPKTSGSKGLQLYVPLNMPVTYDQTKPFARALAEMLEKAHPNKVTSIMKKSLRTGKIFVDWSQNDDHKTTVCVYSLRAKEHPTCSTPVTWKEVESALAKKSPEKLTFDAATVLQRVEKHGDMFEPVLKLKQKLPKLEAP